MGGTTYHPSPFRAPQGAKRRTRCRSAYAAMARMRPRWHPAFDRRPLHHDKARSLQVLDQALGDDRRDEFVGVVDAVAAVKAQREGERIGNVFGSGGRQFVRGIAHSFTIDWADGVQPFRDGIPSSRSIRLDAIGRIEMVSLYVGITDYEWFQFLAASPRIEEVNFWQPGGRTNFRAVRPGELFLFKLHAPRNFIVGGGVFTRAEILPTSIALGCIRFEQWRGFAL